MESHWIKQQDLLVSTLLEELRADEGDITILLGGLTGTGKSIACCKVIASFFDKMESGLHFKGLISQVPDSESNLSAFSKHIVVPDVIYKGSEFIMAMLSPLPRVLLGNGGTTAEAPLSDDLCFLSECRADWKQTRQSWTHLHPNGQPVPYPATSMYMYSLGTTLIHAALVKELLERTIKGHLEVIDNVLILCGGSGAEVIGLNMFLEEYAPDKLVSMDIVDVNAAWEYFLERVVRSDESGELPLKAKMPRLLSSNKLKGRFHCLDLLADDSHDTLMKLVGKSDLILMIYGLTELHDIDRDSCSLCIQKIGESLKPMAQFVVADPFNLRHGKDRWIKGLLKPRDCQSFEFKVRIEESDMLRSQLMPLITRLNLRLNNEVKLSAHVWCLKISHQSCLDFSREPSNARPTIPLAVVVVPEISHVKYFTKWLSLVDSSTLVSSLDGLNAANTDNDIQSSLWHLHSDILNSHNSEEYSKHVVLVTLAQLALVPRSSDLLKQFQSVQLAVVDAAEVFLSPSRESRAGNFLATIDRVITKSRRLVVCSNPNRLSLALPLCGDNRKSFELKFGGESFRSIDFEETNFVKSLKKRFCLAFGISLRVCFCRHESCKAGSKALFVGMGRKSLASFVLTKGQRKTYVRSLETQAGPISVDMDEAVVVVNKPQKLPIARRNQLLLLVACRIIHPERYLGTFSVHFHYVE